MRVLAATVLLGAALRGQAAVPQSRGGLDLGGVFVRVGEDSAIVVRWCVS